MQKQIINHNDINIALINSAEPIISDGQSALDFIMSIHYYHNCSCIALNKEALSDSFFILSTGVAGEILQKISNYRIKLAIIGDFSSYTSQPLKDFIYECNKGQNVFFVPNENDALNKLSNCL